MNGMNSKLVQSNMDVNIDFLRYSHIISSNIFIIRITEGSPEAFLPLIHHVCVSFSRFLARFLASKGYELVGKNDMRFMVCVLFTLYKKQGMITIIMRLYRRKYIRFCETSSITDQH